MVRASRGGLVSLGSLLLLLVAMPMSAQCVGDCSGDGEVTINELILGVNIALGTTPVSACPAFANEMDQVNIAQLIKGVNNALNGCPEPVATATATSTATGVAATPTSTATSPAATATATASAAPPTATSVATSTATGVATVTATGVPTGTATAVATATGVPTGTATAVATATATSVAPASATSTVAATATATLPATATHTVPPTATHTAVATTTATVTVTAPPTATSSPTATVTNTVPPTVTATATPTGTPTETAVPPGEAVGGRAAYMSAGLGGIQALVAAVVTAATNDGGAALVSGLPPPIETNQCSISGETTQSCSEMGSGAGKTIHLVLGANQCVVPGPLGGTGEFDGSITIDSNPNVFGVNNCSPLFLSAAYDVTNLTVMLRDPMDNGTTVAADLNGNVAITGASASCLVGSLSLSVNGTLSSTLMDGSGVEVSFFGTGVTMTNITYSADCVPLIYTLTFNGDAAFTPIAAMPPALTNGLPAEPSFDVEFVNFVMKQNATTTPVTVEMDGTITSGCLGGQFVMDTLAPMAIAAGQLCPNAGQVSVTGSGNSKATVTYQADMSVTVTPQGGQPTNYPSCLVEELQMCVPA